MKDKNIVILGGGFAGVSALKTLAKSKDVVLKEFNVLMIDKKKNFEFRPMLPDVIGGWLSSDALKVDLQKLVKKFGFYFINDEAIEIDFQESKIVLKERVIKYEYFIVCAGSEANFFSNENIKQNCFKLDDISDADEIRSKLIEFACKKKSSNIVIVGGGYTGIEIATNIHYLLSRLKLEFKVIILEQSADILTMLPEWIRDDVTRHLRKLNVEILCNDSLSEYKDDQVFIKSGKVIENAFCIWSAGVKTAAAVDAINVDKYRTRIKVDNYLRILNSNYENVFITGDSSYFYDVKQRVYLRMAVMFAQAQGKIAALNIINCIKGLPLTRYKPFDLGFLIPMAYGKSPGVVLGQNMHGIFGYFLHYCMCVYRSDWKNKFIIIKDFFLRKKKEV